MKKTIKKKCSKCGRVHYVGRSCIKKKLEGNNIYNIIKEKKIYE